MWQSRVGASEGPLSSCDAQSASSPPVITLPHCNAPPSLIAMHLSPSLQCTFLPHCNGPPSLIAMHLPPSLQWTSLPHCNATPSLIAMHLSRVPWHRIPESFCAAVSRCGCVGSMQNTWGTGSPRHLLEDAPRKGSQGGGLHGMVTEAPIHSWRERQGGKVGRGSLVEYSRGSCWVLLAYMRTHEALEYMRTGHSHGFAS